MTTSSTRPTSYVPLRYITYNEYLELIRRIRDAVIADQGHYDYIIGIGRGGLVPATYLSHALNVQMLSIDLSADVEDFSFELLGKIAKKTARGKNVLFVDDINDSGKTIATIRQAMAIGCGDDIRINYATLINNTESITTVDFSAWTIQRSEMADWFVFPWESLS